MTEKTASNSRVKQIQQSRKGSHQSTRKQERDQRCLKWSETLFSHTVKAGFEVFHIFRFLILHNFLKHLRPELLLIKQYFTDIILKINGGIILTHRCHIFTSCCDVIFKRNCDIILASNCDITFASNRASLLGVTGVIGCVLFFPFSFFV